MKAPLRSLHCFSATRAARADGVWDGLHAARSWAARSPRPATTAASQNLARDLHSSPHSHPSRGSLTSPRGLRWFVLRPSVPRCAEQRSRRSRSPQANSEGIVVPLDYYKILGVTRMSSPDAVQRGYRAAIENPIDAGACLPTESTLSGTTHCVPGSPDDEVQILPTTASPCLPRHCRVLGPGPPPARGDPYGSVPGVVQPGAEGHV